MDKKVKLRVNNVTKAFFTKKSKELTFDYGFVVLQ